MYTYFLDMLPDDHDGMYWGNAFYPPGPERGGYAGPGRIIPPLDKWQCWEFMLQANSAPDLADGRQAMWVDGQLAGDFTGIRWRNDMDLKVNTLWLEHYGYDPGDPTRRYWKDQQTVWFDDIVVSGEVKLAKPDRRIFELTIARCRLAPGRTVFIDDSLHNVEAGRAAGLHALHFRNPDALRSDLAALGLLEEKP